MGAASGDVSAGVVGQGEAGGDAFADRFPLDLEALRDGRPQDSERRGGLPQRQQRIRS